MGMLSQEGLDSMLREFIELGERSENVKSSLESTYYNPSESVVPKFQQGTPGFLDFGAGTPAILHGMEAVVPLATPAGEFLQKAFDSNFEPNVMPSASSVISPTLERIAAAAHTAINNIVYAPTTVSPVSSITKGGSNVSSVTNNAVTSFGGGSGSGLGRFAN
jgi:hypothetical protein